MFEKKTIRDVEIKNRRALVRVDFNVPLKEGKVADDTRIRAALPTIEYLLQGGALPILCSHLGRPKGEVKPEFSLAPVAEALEVLLERPVRFVAETIGPQAERAAAGLKPGEVLLLENTRFLAGETSNDPELAAALSKMADLYVNDAFGSAHRAHASTEGVARHLPAVAGLLLERELLYFGRVLDDPARPFLAILGGAKISDKIGVVRSLLQRADLLLIGGGMANTFLAAAGHDMGESLVEESALETASEVMQEGGSKLLLPVDLVVADAFADDARRQVVDVDAMPAGWRALDIGPATVQAFGKALVNARLVVWNGPMGVFEFPRFAEGTMAIASILADAAATVVIGGGDSAAAVNQAGLAPKIDHISTGGGASLELLEGKALPGVAALEDK